MHKAPVLLVSGFPLSQGNADKWSGKTKHRLISYFLSNTSAKTYRSRIVYFKISKSKVGRFLRHTIVQLQQQFAMTASEHDCYKQPHQQQPALHAKAHAVAQCGSYPTDRPVTMPGVNPQCLSCWVAVSSLGVNHNVICPLSLSLHSSSDTASVPGRYLVSVCALHHASPQYQIHSPGEHGQISTTDCSYISLLSCICDQHTKWMLS